MNEALELITVWAAPVTGRGGKHRWRALDRVPWSLPWRWWEDVGGGDGGMVPQWAAAVTLGCGPKWGRNLPGAGLAAGKVLKVRGTLRDILGT